MYVREVKSEQLIGTPIIPFHSVIQCDSIFLSFGTKKRRIIIINKNDSRTYRVQKRSFLRMPISENFVTLFTHNMWVLLLVWLISTFYIRMELTNIICCQTDANEFLFISFYFWINWVEFFQWEMNSYFLVHEFMSAVKNKPYNEPYQHEHYLRNHASFNSIRLSRYIYIHIYVLFNSLFIALKCLMYSLMWWRWICLCMKSHFTHRWRHRCAERSGCRPFVECPLLVFSTQKWNKLIATKRSLKMFAWVQTTMKKTQPNEIEYEID